MTRMPGLVLAVALAVSGCGGSDGGAQAPSDQAMEAAAIRHVGEGDPRWLDLIAAIEPLLTCDNQIEWAEPGVTDNCGYDNLDGLERALEAWDASKISNEELVAYLRDKGDNDCAQMKAGYEGDMPVKFRFVMGETNGATWRLGPITVGEAAALQDELGAEDLGTLLCDDIAI